MKYLRKRGSFPSIFAAALSGSLMVFLMNMSVWKAALAGMAVGMLTSLLFSFLGSVSFRSESREHHDRGESNKYLE